MAESRGTTESLESLAARLDRSRMADVIKRLPVHIELALAQTLPRIPVGPFKRAVVVAMGGSALPGDVLKGAFGEHLHVPVTVIRNYALPIALEPDTLVIASSFSGSTEETLSAVEHIPAEFHNVVVVTAGDTLRALAEKRGYPVVLIPRQNEPPGFQPRSAIGYSVTYFARVLAAAGAMSDVSEELGSVAQLLRNLDVRKEAEECAYWLRDRIPVVYTDEPYLMPVARVAKIKFNENSKCPAFFNALPEVNHNEMMGFVSRLAKFGILYLSDASSHPRMADRFRVMQEVFVADGLDHVEFREWKMVGQTPAEKIFSGLMFMEHCSYSLALLHGFDPTPVTLIENFKKALPH